MSKAAVRTEHEEQREFVQWFRRRWPEVLIFAIPNGGQRNPATAARLRAEGVLAGIPDLFVPEWELWIEMKRTQGGQVTNAQQRVMGHLREIEYTAIVCHGCEDAKQQVSQFAAKLHKG